ncbi:MAG: Mrp/NBP35 family ATP-binding protein [Candidatus Delongbacteria bacterium]|nr:Mrp/NBP35 family ATP-binding protein [Candidatus Delongbacteria bacterium]MCG2760045.1 Mrp/NBP35 family ATP-binding protein [Candidatus Delongbacteria bacterium]
MSTKAEYKNLLPNAKNIIAVASGKGGVGKSTIAANLAVAISKLGYSVGLLDADIYGPSIPKIFDTGLKDTVIENKRLIPIEKYGVKTLSIGNLLEPGKAAIWRGPLIHSALTQMISDTEWGELDYFILDLPPGTGDVQLSIAQSLKITGIIAVSTPQELSLIDVVKAIDMFEKVMVPIIGIVENMSYFVCDSCKKKHFIFGDSQVVKYAEEAHIDLLAQIPIEKEMMNSAEIGEPYAINDKDQVYENMAVKVINAVNK